MLRHHTLSRTTNLALHRTTIKGTRLYRHTFKCQYSTFKDPYRVLNVEKSANASKIKKAYFDLVKKYHPDHNKDPEAKTKFIEIQNAYEILSDPSRKSMYDQTGSMGGEGMGEGAAGGGGFGGGFSSGFPGGGGGTNFDPNDFLKNIFGAAGRGGRRGNPFDPFSDFHQPQSARGPGYDLDLNIQVNLSFMEAAMGKQAKISVPRMEDCSSCSGEGVAKGHQIETCKRCKGSGQETKVRGSFLFSSTCGGCGGAGSTNPHPCTACSGSGSKRESKEIQFEIPSGVNNNDTVMIRSQGNKYKGHRGDLLVTFKVSKSPTFTRKSNDIHLETTIDLKTCLLGGTINIPTIHGSVEMKVNAGTQSDDIKKLTNKGIYNASTMEQGHQYVKVKVEFPKTLTPRQRQLLEECFSESNESTSTKDAENSKETKTNDHQHHKDNQSENKSQDVFSKFKSWIK